MNDDERMKIYLSTLRPQLPEHLNALKKWCQARNYPVIRSETEDLLRSVIAMKKPSRILEIGTCAGYSTTFIFECVETYLFSDRRNAVSGIDLSAEIKNADSSENFDREKIITTLEIRPEHVKEAEENFSRFGISDYIRVIEGDAEKSLDYMLSSDERPEFDFVFIDAAKGQYSVYFDRAAKLLSDDGVIVCDNVLQDESLLDSRYTILQRDRTIHDRMRAFLNDITHRRDFVTDVLPIADGMSVSVHKIY